MTKEQQEQLLKRLRKLKNWADQSPSGPHEAEGIANWVRTIINEAIALIKE